jgi:hypothetical protein
MCAPHDFYYEDVPDQARFSGDPPPPTPFQSAWCMPASRISRLSLEQEIMERENLVRSSLRGAARTALRLCLTLLNRLAAWADLEAVRSQAVDSGCGRRR